MPPRSVIDFGPRQYLYRVETINDNCNKCREVVIFIDLINAPTADDIVRTKFEDGGWKGWFHAPEDVVGHFDWISDPTRGMRIDPNYFHQEERTS
jgi:hypothetical protein